MTAQLVLRFPSAFAQGAHELLPNAAQDEAQAWLDRSATWPLRRLAIYGAAGSGKSHLAQAWAARIGAVIRSTPPETWPGAATVLDSLDTVANEPALLHLINAAAESGHPLLLLSRLPPGRLPVRLPDLASRLRATTAVEIAATDEAFLALLLTRLLAERQLRLKPALQSWLLTQLPRNPAALHEAVARLDAAALESGKPVTQPFAMSVLELKNPTRASPQRPGPG